TRALALRRLALPRRPPRRSLHLVPLPLHHSLSCTHVPAAVGQQGAAPHCCARAVSFFSLLLSSAAFSPLVNAGSTAANTLAALDDLWLPYRVPPFTSRCWKAGLRPRRVRSASRLTGASWLAKTLR